ncbi:hypothetical protein F5B18DRAFT_654962 [Nemania serpens]|nr:hypothetical protein F5B18DRAFT_654962 [Nemania serpens]
MPLTFRIPGEVYLIHEYKANFIPQGAPRSERVHRDLFLLNDVVLQSVYSLTDDERNHRPGGKLGRDASDLLKALKLFYGDVEHKTQCARTMILDFDILNIVGESSVFPQHHGLPYMVATYDLTSQDVAYLRSKDAFSAPSEAVCEALLRTYYTPRVMEHCQNLHDYQNRFKVVYG